jgi:hypothetical protein
MRSTRVILIAAITLLPWTAVLASERGLMIRAGDLYAEPFIDAAKLGPLTPEQPVTIVERRGGWLLVEVGGKRGWVRLLNVRLPAVLKPANATTALRTGSSGRTVVTGVKGLDEEDIRNASIDRAQQARLDALAASDADAQQHAAQSNLKENKVAYLKPGKTK